LREVMPLGHGTEFVVTRDGQAQALWTYGGTKFNRTLARGRQHGAKFDALKLEWHDTIDALPALPTELQPWVSSELQELAPMVKFHLLLPQALLGRQLARRIWVTKLS
jgi:hypothetical protein